MVLIADDTTLLLDQTCSPWFGVMEHFLSLLVLCVAVE